MAAVSLFWESNMAALTLCENTLLNTISSYDIMKVVPDRGRLIHFQELRAKRVVVTFNTFKTSIFHWILVLALFIHFRHGPNTFSQLRYRNRAEVTLLMCEQRPYPVWFSCQCKSYPLLCEDSLN